jgi:hypothetical protein
MIKTNQEANWLAFYTRENSLFILQKLIQIKWISNYCSRKFPFVRVLVPYDREISKYVVFVGWYVHGSSNYYQEPENLELVYN